MECWTSSTASNSPELRRGPPRPKAARSDLRFQDRRVAVLESGRTPSLRFKPQEGGELLVSVHDGPSTGITVTLPLFVLPPTWVAEQRGLLARVREVYPREVVETSPGAYEWRGDRHS
ncbi:DUF5959 family protein [Streptomyces sp. NPDC046924]|uniref:DUF5959 family protein n=1 Tax=Streptomyces sp. NPDC046924 TaxID=3155136 RepID=UPI0033D49085